MIVNKEQILTKKNEQKHEVVIDPDNPELIMEVWVRDITFLDIQRAAQKMFILDNNTASLDLHAYWEHAFSNWVVKTNPELSTEELLNLNSEVGQQIANLLPKPDELAEAMQGGFTKANS